MELDHRTSEYFGLDWTVDQLRMRVGHTCDVYVVAGGRQVATFRGIMGAVEPRVVGWSTNEEPVYFCQFESSGEAAYGGFYLDPAIFERSWFEHHMTLVIAQGPTQIALEGR